MVTFVPADPKVVLVIPVTQAYDTLQPDGALTKVAGEEMLGYLVERMRQGSRLIHSIVVATTTDPVDDAGVQFCKSKGIDVYRGSNTDALLRERGAADEFKARIIARVMPNCPLTDPGDVDDQIYQLSSAKRDYITTGGAGKDQEVSCLPQGMASEVFTRAALERAHRGAVEPYERAHPTAYFTHDPARGFHVSYTSPFSGKDYSAHSLVARTPQGVRTTSEVIEHFTAQGRRYDASTQEIVAVLESRSPACRAVPVVVHQLPPRANSTLRSNLPRPKM